MRNGGKGREKRRERMLGEDRIGDTRMRENRVLKRNETRGKGETRIYQIQGGEMRNRGKGREKRSE
jgi:hypothetical protein